MTHLRSVDAETETAPSGAGARSYSFPMPVRHEPYLSVPEAARALRVSPSTLRRYLGHHAAHLDLVRMGREARIAVSSIPTLARIRDLRRRRVGKQEIDHLLALSPDALGNLVAAAPVQAVPSPDVEVVKLLKEMRREVAEMRREHQDSEVVLRQAMSSMVFLLDKYNKEVQFHASEERIANRERDLSLAEQEAHIRRLVGRQAGTQGVFSALAALARQAFGVLWKGGSRGVAYSPK